MLGKLGMVLLEGIQVIGISAIIIIVLQVFLIRPQEIDGDSMYPYLKNGQHIITEMVSYRINEPKRGEIIVFKYPLDRERDYIKRIIALPGERVEIKDSKVIIFNNENPNGLVLDEYYLDEQTITRGKGFINDGEIVEVPEGKYIVFGDNRDKSSDSRQWGFISKDDIIGRAILRYWPPQSFGILEHNINY